MKSLTISPLVGLFLCLSIGVCDARRAHAQNTVTGILGVVVQAQGLGIVFTPSAPSIACNAAAGTVVSAMSTAGGDGNPVTFSLVSQTDTHTDFAVSGSNIVVGAGGINVADCGAAGGTKNWSVTVQASQP